VKSISHLTSVSSRTPPANLDVQSLAEAIEQAAVSEGTTVSAWIADTAAHRLRLDAGRRGIAEWERQHGPLTPDELAEGLARARALLRRPPTRKSA
jgi:hypothetical protein